MEDAYRLLKGNKLGGESFSDEIRRVFIQREKGSLRGFFGVLSDAEGKQMLNDLEKQREANIKMQKERLKEWKF